MLVVVRAQPVTLRLDVLSAIFTNDGHVSTINIGDSASFVLIRILTRVN